MICWYHCDRAEGTTTMIARIIYVMTAGGVTTLARCYRQTYDSAGGIVINNHSCSIMTTLARDGDGHSTMCDQDHQGVAGSWFCWQRYILAGQTKEQTLSSCTSNKGRAGVDVELA